MSSPAPLQATICRRHVVATNRCLPRPWRMLAVGVTVLAAALAGCANKQVASPPAPIVAGPPTATTPRPQGAANGIPPGPPSTATLTNQLGTPGVAGGPRGGPRPVPPGA